MNEQDPKYDIEMAGVFQKAMEKKFERNSKPGNVEKPWREFDCREILIREYSEWLAEMVYRPSTDRELQELLDIINGATFRYLQICHANSQRKLLQLDMARLAGNDR